MKRQGLIGTNPDPKRSGEKINRWIDKAYENAAKEPEFREGLTLLVSCGIGRGWRVDLPSYTKRENWRFESLSAPDLLTLSWLADFKPLSLWRLLESQEKLAELGVELQNINGLLNLVAWARSLGGHLVPHGDVPGDFGKGHAPMLMMIEQNALRDARREAAAQWDPHAVLDIDGEWVKVRKDGVGLFDEDRNIPFYVTEQDRADRWPSGVYEAPLRPWWCELETAEGTTGHWAFERSMMLKTWVSRAVPVLEPALPGLPAGPVLLRAKFEGRIGDRQGGRRGRKLLTFEDAKAAVEVSADVTTATVSLVAHQRFEEAIFHPENIAERALVERIIEGFSALADHHLASIERDRLVVAIVPDSSARQSHGFVARGFRDFVIGSVPRSPVTVDSDDSALIKLELGWRVRDRAAGGDIQGKDPCIRFLNDIVRLLEDELCDDLRQLDRHATISRALANHESAILEQQNWTRTAAALLSLHHDKESALKKMAEHQFELNAVFQATRLLVEFAVCECPLQGGRSAGVLDLSKLMAKVLMIAHFGGWSDAIRWEAMPPLLRVTPLGDIHAKLTFQEEVLAPFGRVGSDLRVREGVRSYPKNLEDPEVRTTAEGVLPADFWKAWQEETGASLDDMRKFVDYVENIGIDVQRAIIKLPRSKLASTKFNDLPIAPEAAVALVDFLTFRSRARWRDVPEGYDEKDRQPWRFRRRLSVLRKPLIQIDDADEPTIIVAPGVLRDAFGYMLENYHRGDFPPSQLKPKMKQWAGKSRDRIGRQFTQSVAKRLGELGWETQTEIKLTKLLRKGFERDYGDIDVLAWNQNSGRVLIIECKDVQYRKTYGEIAEQLWDFRGELAPDGKPDLLLRHLNRIEIISQHVPELVRHIGFNQTPRIEGHLVFKNPVPMQFAWERMAERVALHIFAELDKI